MGNCLTIATAATPNLEWWPLAVNCFRSFLDFKYPEKNPILKKIVGYNRPASWYKVKLILEQSDGWFLWVDSDAKIYNLDYDLESIKVEGKYLYCSADQNGINAGVMLIHINDITRMFFAHVYAMTQFINVRWEEQNAIHKLIDENHLNCRDWIKVMKCSEFNCYSAGQYENDAEYVSDVKPFIYHTPGFSPSDRQKRLLDHKYVDSRNNIQYLFDHKNAVGVEVGVQVAKYSYNTLQHFCSKLTLIDPWIHINGYIDSSNLTNPQKDYEYSLVKKIFQNSPHVEIMKEFSAEAVKSFEDNSLDFAYIDANHCYDSVRQDIELWWPKVKAGGYLCGHDYLNSKEFGTVIEVKSAVDDFISNINFNEGFVTNEEYPSWFIKK